MTPALPPGFVLDGASGGGAPSLPPGFVLDGRAESAPTEADAAAIVMPNRFARHTGQINPGTLPTTDEARTAIEGWSVPDGLSLMGIAKNTLLGALDIGQGRVRMDEAGNPLSIRPTGPSFDALGLGAGLSPAAGTGRAIAQMAEHGAPLSSLYERNRLMPAAPAERPPVATVAPGAPVPEMRITAPRAVDPQQAGDKVFLPSGREVPVQYEVVDASTLRTSHTGDGTPNPAFPAELQPRDRTRGASDIQINRIANSLQPERLGRSSSAMEGAPIIGPDGVVESGNARTIAILRAYKLGDQNAAAYREYLAQQGFDTAGMDRPVLVRRRQGDMTPDERARFAQEANAEVGLSMGAAERAATDATRLDAATLNLYRGGDVGAADNAQFVRAFVGNVAEKGQEGAIATAGGTLSVDGAVRMRNALVQKAYGDSALVAGLAETGDDAIKAFGGGMMDAAGSMAKLSSDIGQGRVDPAVDISKGLAEAVQAIKTAREGRIPLKDVVGQRDAFGGGLSEQAEALLTVAYGPELRGRMNRRAFGGLLEDYARLAGEQTPGPRLFGGNLTWQDLLGEAGKKGGATIGTAPIANQNALMPMARSAGAAATPSELTAMTPREALASRTTGERYQMAETPKPGDTTEYIPGIKPTKAEVELNPAVSREAKVLRQEHPEGWTAKDVADNEIYHEHLDNIAGTPTMALRAREARAARAERDLKSTWEGKMKADPQPVFDRVAEIKAGPDGRRPLVRRELDSVLDEFKDAKGNTISDPEILYGVRKHIDDMLSKEAQRQNPINKRAEAALLDVKAELDGVIEAAAPGFKQYLANFQEASRPIDVMELMQEAKVGLTTGADRMISFAKFDRLMKDLVSDRGASGVNAAKSIDNATWEKLVAMHKSMQRTAYARQLGQVAGSDTAQRMSEMMRQGAMQVAAHAVVGTATGGLGNLAIPFVSRQIKAHQTKNRLMQHINPDLSKYPDRGP